MAKCYAWVGESKFLSTPSVRRATRPSLRIRHTACISIHALREEGDRIRLRNFRFLVISIHALREEGDRKTKQENTEKKDFYPRPPRGGRPLPTVLARHSRNIFLSTPSARRATVRLRCLRCSDFHFYPRPPRGGRLSGLVTPHVPERFLSTPSARRATGHPLTVMADSLYFYPRPPRGGRPVDRHLAVPVFRISIHALREEGDKQTVAKT